MTDQLQTVDPAAIMERVITTGDLAKLTPVERVNYYHALCNSLGLNPLTKPFEYILLDGKMTLYARRDATDQLRKLYDVSVIIVGRETINGVHIVTARATLPNGRTDESTGAVPIEKEGGQWQEPKQEGGKRWFKADGTTTPLRGEAMANAIMKAETKAKRRVTLSIVGLGWIDETELETIPSAQPRHVNMETGEIINPQPTVTVVDDPRPALVAALRKEVDAVVAQGTANPYTRSQVDAMTLDELKQAAENVRLLLK